MSASPFITAIRRHAAERPRAPALTCGESRLDWAGFAASVEQAAAAFQRHGVSPGDRVAIVAASSLAYVVLFFGGVAAGACMVPMPNKSGARTLERLIADCGPRILIVDAAAVEILADCRPDGAAVIALDTGAAGTIALDDFLAGAGHASEPQTSPDAPFNIIYSSGTTGTPKGIVHSSDMRLRQASRDTFMLGADSVMLLATPLYSNTTLLPLLATVFHGGHTVLMPKFDAEAYLRVAEAVRATHTMLVPVQYQRIVAHPRFDATDLSAFVLKQCTGAPLPVEVKRALITRWPGRFLEVYGLTEGGCTVILDATAHPDKLATVGRPAPGTDIRIIDQRGNELPKGRDRRDRRPLRPDDDGLLRQARGHGGLAVARPRGKRLLPQRRSRRLRRGRLPENRGPQEGRRDLGRVQRLCVGPGIRAAAASGRPRGGRDRHPERGVGGDPMGGGGAA